MSVLHNYFICIHTYDSSPSEVPVDAAATSAPLTAAEEEPVRGAEVAAERNRHLPLPVRQEGRTPEEDDTSSHGEEMGDDDETEMLDLTDL